MNRPFIAKSLTLLLLACFATAESEAGLFCKLRCRMRCHKVRCVTPCPPPVHEPATCDGAAPVEEECESCSDQLPAEMSADGALAPIPADSDYNQVLEALSSYVASTPEVKDFCSLKQLIPAYGDLINGLTADEKLQAEGVTICFPNYATWDSNTGLRDAIKTALSDAGVL